MRKVLWIAGGLIALLLAVAILLPLFIDEDALLKVAASKVESETGVQVKFAGQVSLSLFPNAALRTNDVSVSAADGSLTAEAGYVEAGVALLPLLRRSVEMDSITIDDLTLTTVAADAEAARAAEIDTSTLSPAELDAYYAARRELREQAAGDSAVAVLAAPLALEVGSLALRNIRLRTVDEYDALISEVTINYLSGEDLNTDGRPIPLKAQLLVAGSEPEMPVQVTLEGRAAVDLETERASLSDFVVDIEGASADPIQLTANGEALLATEAATLQLTIEGKALNGSGTVRYAALESPAIDATLQLSEFTPALLALAGPDAAAAAPQESGDPNAPLPLNALRMMDTRARLRIDTVVLGAHRLEQVDAELRVLEGVASLKPVTAQVHGGAISFEAELNGRYNTATLHTEGGLRGLQVASATAALESELTASGIADLRWTLDGSGSTSAELSNSLEGPISFDTNDITVHELALERMICGAVALVNQEKLSAEFPTDTRFDALSADVHLSGGVATLDPLTAKLPAVSLGGNGTYQLEDEALRASFRAQLSAGLEEVDPACRVNERFQALRWPVECRGTLADDPASWCAIDTDEIIRDLLENEAKGKIADEAGKLLKKLFE